MSKKKKSAKKSAHIGKIAEIGKKIIADAKKIRTAAGHTTKTTKVFKMSWKSAMKQTGKKYKKSK